MRLYIYIRRRDRVRAGGEEESETNSIFGLPRFLSWRRRRRRRGVGDLDAEEEEGGRGLLTSLLAADADADSGGGRVAAAKAKAKAKAAAVERVRAARGDRLIAAFGGVRDTWGWGRGEVGGSEAGGTQRLSPG